METTEPMTVEEAAQALLQSNEDPTPEAEDLDETVEEAGAEDEFEASEEYEDEDESYEDDEDDETEAEEGPQTFRVKVNGEEVEVSLDELTRGYAGQEYIQKGMRDVAAQRKQAEESAAALQQQQAQLVQLYQTLQQQGAVSHPGEPPQYDANDPLGYLEAKAQYDAKVAAHNAQQNEINALSQQQTEAQRAAMQKHAQEQMQILQRDIPAFANPDTAKTLQQELHRTGASYGFTAEELDGIADARTVKVLHDAMKYRQLQEGKKAVEGKVKKAAPKAKPKAGRRVSKAVKQKQNMQARLQQTGSVDDAVRLLMANRNAS